MASPRRFWYPACQSGDLRGAPLSVELMGTPLVAFRGPDATPQVLVDRCPHRNVPLSLGRVTEDGTLECGYHGWCFDGGGACTAVPGLDAEAASPNRTVSRHAAAESDGFVWIWGEPDADPTSPPPRLPGPSRPGSRRMRYGRTIFVRDLDSTVHAAVENALDVPHTAFLHGGIFRGRKDPRPITAVRREIPGGLEVQYLGEPLGFGPLTLSSEHTGRTFDHHDRFLLPSTAQIEYRVAGWLRIVNTILHLPMGPFRTRAWFVLEHETPVPAWLASPIIRWRGQAILRQDIDMLAAQTERTQRFGGERYTSTELDLLGNGIWRLLRRAERAEDGGAVDADRSDDTGAQEATVTLRI